MNLKLHLINPNTTASMTATMVTTAQAVTNSATQIVGLTAPHGAVSIESHFDEAMSIVGVSDCIRTATSDDSDGIILACFGDPNIWAARELATAPVIGIAQAAFIMASLISTEFAVVTSLQRTVIQAKHLLQMYGYSHVCPQVLAVDLPVLALEDDTALQSIITHAKMARDNGAGAVVLGCGGMAHLQDTIEKEVGIPIVDGVQSATKLLEAMAGMGLKTSKFGDLAAPIAKPFLGELLRFGQV